jgi:hypothetical protein
MMSERLVMQESLFYEFRLKDHVSCDHLLRRIDRVANCSELRQRLAGYYGRLCASISPHFLTDRLQR